MRLLKASIVLITLLLLLVGAPTAEVRQIRAAESRMEAGTWHIEMVDSDTGTIKYTSLALDDLGRPHIGYSEWDEVSDDKYDLKYAWYDGTNWHIETVDGEDWSEYASLELDGSDRPCISYYDYGTLGYTWHDGTNWHFQTVDSKGGYYTSLELDGSDRPHISYLGNFGDYPDWNWDLKYARYDGANWHVETVDGESDVGFYTSLALDELDRPHISYHDDALDDLKYAWYDGASWHIETVDTEGGSYTSLALDSSGRPHIGYHGDTGLKYAWHDGASWHIETVDSEGGTYVSLVLDESGQPRIGYYGGSALKYAWHDGSDWYVETVDSPWVGSNTSLALDESGYPYISYSGGGGLKYAYLTPFPPLSLEKRAIPGESLYYNGILTYTLTFSGSDLGVRLWDPLPDTVHCVSGSITGNVIPMAVYNPTTHAITWEGMVSTDTVQEVRFQVTPDITVTKSLAAPLPIVNTAWLTDTDNDRVITATATANLLPIPLSLGKQATPREGLRNGDTLTYTLTLYGPGLSARLWDPLPDAVRYVSGSITSVITPAAFYSSTAKTVVWQGTLPTDTVQTIRFQVTPGITGTGSLSLSLPIVNTAWLTDTANRSISATAIVNGQYVYLPLVLRGR